MIGGQKQEGSDIIVQILINGKDRTRKYDKFGSEIQYNITWDSDKPSFKGFDGELTIVLNKGAKIAEQRPTISSENLVQEIQGSPIYKIKVRQYMTKPASPEFDFHNKWNNGVPMPMRIMVGRKLKETRGMVQMELWGEITEEVTHSCIYYDMDANLITDKQFDEWGKELVKLQSDYPEIASRVCYAKAFKDWDASTGAFLPLKDEWVVRKSKQLLNYKNVKEND